MFDTTLYHFYIYGILYTIIVTLTTFLKGTINTMKNNILNQFEPWEFTPILDSISDAVFIDDKDGYALWCNKACYDLYKITPSDLRGLHVSDLEKNGIFSPSVANIVLTEKREATIIHENKEGRKLLSTGTPIFDEDNNITKIITTSRDITELSTLQNRLESVQSSLDHIQNFDIFSTSGIVANSHAMFNVIQLAKKLAPVDSTVLITGESGVGKGVVAEFLHNSGNRKSAPFITVNCGAIPENLIESELFGYEKGAFTGARADGKKGFFEAAQHGTIFLDEISELPLNLQVKLLQVIQERVITRVGGTQRIPVDVRVISATNRNLHDYVLKGKFREDLYYRLNVVPINVPPLRERPEDTLPLIRKFLDHYNKKYKLNKNLEPDALAILLKFNWPGNVRELQNIVERLILTSNEDVITINNLPEYLINHTFQEGDVPLTAMTLQEALNAAEKNILKDALTKHKTTRAMAKALSVSQPTIVRKLHKYNLNNIDT